MANYLITGGAGFVGSNIANELLNRGEDVRILDNFSTGKRENLTGFSDHSHFQLIEGDLRDYDAVKKAVKGVEFVLHQGALPSVPRSIQDPVSSNNVNVNGTLNVLEASREFGVKRVVFASSSSVYGNNETMPKVETMPVAPLSPYALTKYAGERYCQIYYNIYGLETVCLRYFNVFGPNQDPDSQYSAVIPKFISLMKNGRQPSIYGDGSQSRDFTYITNNVEANILACHRENVAGEVFNIACGNRFTLNELVVILNDLGHTSLEPVYLETRAGDVKHSLADISKASTGLGFKVVTGFRDGLEHMVKFMNR